MQVAQEAPNYPLFKGRLVPFIGDYIDIAPAQTLVMTSDKKWRFNTEPSGTFAFHLAWTDNRDVRPPADHN